MFPESLVGHQRRTRTRSNRDLVMLEQYPRRTHLRQLDLGSFDDATVCVHNRARERRAYN